MEVLDEGGIERVMREAGYPRRSPGALVTLKANDFASQWGVSLEPLIRTGRGPDAVLEVFELGKRMGSWREEIRLPETWDPAPADCDADVRACREELERALARHVIQQLWRFEAGAFFGMRRLSVSLPEPIASAGDPTPLPWFARQSGDDMELHVVPKAVVDVSLEVNRRVRREIRAGFGAARQTWRPCSVSAWRPNDLQSLALFDWYAMGVIVAILRSFIRRLRWHEPLFGATAQTEHELDRDIDRSIVVYAEERGRGSDLHIRCVYCADPIS